MSIVLFTLVNTTNNDLGPFGLGAVTVPANGNVAIQPPLNGLLVDNRFIAAASAGLILLFIGGVQVQQSNMFNILDLMSKADLSNSYLNIVGNGTNVVKSGSGILHAIIIGNNNTEGTVTIYDNTTNSGTVIMSLTLGTPSGGLLSSSGQSGPEYLNALNLGFSTGLTVVTSGSTNNNITLIYQ